MDKQSRAPSSEISSEMNVGDRGSRSRKSQSKPKTRSRRSLSRKNKPAALDDYTKTVVTLKEPHFSLYPSLAHFNYHEYEQTLMKNVIAYTSKQEAKDKISKVNPDPQTPTPTNPRKTPAAHEPLQKSSYSHRESSSVKILKPAPPPDEHNNSVVQSTEEIEIDSKLSKPYSISYIAPPKQRNQRVQFQGLNANYDSEILELSDLVLESDYDLRKWLDIFTNAYLNEAKLIQMDDNMNDFEKIKRENLLLTDWIRDLYEQSEAMLDALDDVENTSNTELQDELTQMKQKLQECHAERNQWKAKANGLEYENNRSGQMIEKLNQDILQLKENQLIKNQNHGKVEKDFDSLKQLLIRLRNFGIWDLDGLDMSTETFMAIFGGHQHMFGTKLKAFDEMERNASGMKEELAQMRHEREHLRAKLFSKERNLQRLKMEEAQIQAGIKFAKAEEGALRNKIEDLRAEARALTEGNFEIDDDFVKL